MCFRRTLNEHSGNTSECCIECPQQKGIKTSPAHVVIDPSSGNFANSMVNYFNFLPSPSKYGTTTTTNIQTQMDSLSSATTTSTATTVVPKELGEMCRRSSDSDLSVTPKGK